MGLLLILIIGLVAGTGTGLSWLLSAFAAGLAIIHLPQR